MKYEWKSSEALIHLPACSTMLAHLWKSLYLTMAGNTLAVVIWYFRREIEVNGISLWVYTWQWTKHYPVLTWKVTENSTSKPSFDTHFLLFTSTVMNVEGNLMKWKPGGPRKRPPDFVASSNWRKVYRVYVSASGCTHGNETSSTMFSPASCVRCTAHPSQLLAPS